MNKYLKIILFLLGVILIIIFIFFISLLGFKAYSSYKVDCTLSEEEIGEKINSGYILGYFDSNTTELKVFVEKNSPRYEEILKHEQCHKFIHSINMSGSCSFPPSIIWEEMVCYLSEYF